MIKKILGWCVLLCLFVGGQSLAQTTSGSTTTGVDLNALIAALYPHIGTNNIPYTDTYGSGYYKREFHLDWKPQWFALDVQETYGPLPLSGNILSGRAYTPYNNIWSRGAQPGNYGTSWELELPVMFDGDDAELYIRVKNPYGEGAISYRDVHAVIFGTKGHAEVNLIDNVYAEHFGFISAGGTYRGNYAGSFVKSFDNRNGMALILEDGYVKLWVESFPWRGGMVFSDTYVGEIGDITSIAIDFKGSASLDEVQLKEDGVVVLRETFDVDATTSASLFIESGAFIGQTLQTATGTIQYFDPRVTYPPLSDIKIGESWLQMQYRLEKEKEISEAEQNGNPQSVQASQESGEFVQSCGQNQYNGKNSTQPKIPSEYREKCTTKEEDKIDPINLANGSFELIDTWLSLPQGISFSVTYDNQLEYVGPLGNNRDHNHNILATFDEDGDIWLMLGDGTNFVFTRTGSRVWRHEGIKAEATFDRSGNLSIQYSDGTRERYYTYSDALGTKFLLRNTRDSYNQGLTYTYNGDLLTTITHTQGGSIRLLYDNQDRIVGLIDHTGRGVVTQYDADNNLTNVHFDYGTATKNVSYTYTSGFDPVTQDHLNHNLLTITDAEGQVYVTNEYDANDAVIYQNYGGDEGRLSYDRDSNGFVTATTVTARNGSETRYEFGAFENVTSRTTNTAGGSVRHEYDYDNDGRITLTRNAEGQETRYIYDTNGNLDRVVVSPRPGFSEPDRVTSFRYDPATSQLTQKTLPDGSVIDYTRNAQGRVTQTTITAQSHNGQTQTRTMTYDYNTQGQLTTLTNQIGEEVHFTYHNNLLTSQSIPSLGITKTRVYNNKGYLTSFTDGEGNVWTFTPNDRGQTTKVVSPEGVIQVFDYDLTNNLTLQAVIEGATAITSQYQYNELDLLTQAQLPENRTWDYTWSPHHMIQTITSPKGTEMSFLYDEFDRVISQTVSGNGESATVSIDYDIMGRIVSRTDALGHLTRYDYNAWGQLETLTDADGNVWRLVYDDTDLVGLSLTDSLGTALKVQTRQYNGFGQVVSETDHTLTSPNIQLTKSYTYDVLGRMVTSTDPNGNTTYYSYDAAKRMVAVTDPLGNTQSFVYDKNNNLTIHTLTDSAGVAHVTSYSYDNDNRLVVMMDNLGQINRYQYNDRGQVVGFSDAKNISQAYVYNDAGELVQVNQHDGEQAVVTQYTYDAHGNLIAMTDANGNISTWQYDYRDRPVTLTYPDGRTMSYEWDDHGNITSWTDTNGTVVHNSYDSLHRLVQRDINHGQGVGGVATEYYQYDGAGRLIFATDDLGQDVTFDYDGGDRLLTESNNNETVSYAYDDNSNMTAISYPSAKVFDRSFDAGERLTGIAWINASTSLTPSSHRQDTVTQRFDSLRKLESLGSNGTQSTYSYDPLLRVARITHSNQGDAPYSDITFAYSYDPVGNIVSDGRDNYTYDDISQLKEINYNVGPHRIGSDGLSAQDGGVVHLNQGGNQRRDTRDYDAMGNRQQHDTTVPRTDRFDTYDSSRGGTNREPVSYQEDVGTELALSSKGTGGNLSSEEAQHIVSRETDDITVIDEYLVAQKGNNKGNSQSQGNQGNNAQGNNSNTTNGQSNNTQQSSNSSQQSNTGPSQNNLADRCAWKASQNNPGGGRQKKCQGVGNSGSGSQNTSVGTGGNLSNTGNNTQTGNGEGSSDGGRSDDNETFTYSTNNLNQYTSISDEAGNSIGFVYDANGNMIENDTFMFTYDYKNRLIEARLLGDEYMVVTMSYDVLGRRTTKIIDRKSNEGETFMYTYAGAEVLSEHVSYNIGEGRNYTKEYIYGQGIDDVRGFIMTRGDEVRQFWYDKNHLGSVIAITDEEGKIVESYRYDGFGNILIGESKNAIKQTTGPGTKNEQRNVKVDSTGSVGGFSKSWLQNNRLYTSREYDAELNLYYYRGRHYDPRVGRFIQRDPIGYADDTNLYRYVANNPLKYTDPWGLNSKPSVDPDYGINTRKLISTPNSLDAVYTLFLWGQQDATNISDQGWLTKYWDFANMEGRVVFNDAPYDIAYNKTELDAAYSEDRGDFSEENASGTEWFNGEGKTFPWSRTYVIDYEYDILNDMKGGFIMIDGEPIQIGKVGNVLMGSNAAAAGIAQEDLEYYANIFHQIYFGGRDGVEQKDHVLYEQGYNIYNDILMDDSLSEDEKKEMLAQYLLEVKDERMNQ